MRQNFNPQAADPAGNTFIYSSWIHQGCRPRFDSNGENKWNARQQARDSVCFFCVEPCRDEAVHGETATTANQMRAAECVGRGGANVWNASPIPLDNSMKLFEDCSDTEETDETDAADAFSNCDLTIESDFGQTVWDASAPSGANMKLLNFYSVKADVMLYNTEIASNHPLSLKQDVSQIQYAQIDARSDTDEDTS